MNVLKWLFGRRKCELLRACERELLWLSCRDYFAGRAQARSLRKSRHAAKKLERRGIL